MLVSWLRRRRRTEPARVPIQRRPEDPQGEEMSVPGTAFARRYEADPRESSSIRKPDDRALRERVEAALAVPEQKRGEQQNPAHD